MSLLLIVLYMIKSFKCKKTEKVWDGSGVVTKWPQELQEIARRKLRMLAAAEDIKVLLIPPANRLEKLKGDRSGQYSIRINGQWRICFEWNDNNAHSVEITDYH